MSHHLPPIDPQLAEQLSIIIENKTFDKTKNGIEWESKLLSMILTRLDQIIDVSNEPNEDIITASRRIKSHINSHFLQSPPFTIPRIAEVLIDPTKEGYDLEDSNKIIKLFNSLTKLFLVSSTVDDFPPVEMLKSDSGDIDVTTTIVRTSVGPSLVAKVPLVEIPWLDGESSVRNNQLPSEPTDKDRSETDPKEKESQPSPEPNQKDTQTGPESKDKEIELDLKSKDNFTESDKQNHFRRRPRDDDPLDEISDSVDILSKRSKADTNSLIENDISSDSSDVKPIKEV